MNRPPRSYNHARTPQTLRNDPSSLFFRAVALVLFAMLGSLAVAGESEKRTVFPASAGPFPRETLTSVRPLRPENLSQEMEFAIALRMRNFPEMRERIERRERIRDEEKERNYRPLPGDYEQVVAWLKDEGFQITLRDPNRLTVFAKGSLAQIQKSLQVEMVEVTVEGFVYHAARTAPSLPENLAAGVLGINGLQPYHKMHTFSVPPSPTVSNAPPYTIGEILKAYDANDLGVSGAGQKIAVLLTCFPADSDLTAFWAENGIPQTLDNIEEVNVNGNSLTTNTGELGEITLDVEWSSGIAPGAKIRIYAAGSFSYFDIVKGLMRILADLPNQPQLKELSMSFGGTESDFSGYYSDLMTESQYFADIASSGVTIFNASGDGGSNPDSTRHEGGGPLQAEYPASDPSLTSVGGTNLILDLSTGQPTSETGWSLSGGGVSIDFQQPVWQTGLNVPVASGRCVPDVSLVASPDTAASYYFQGGDAGIAGTSWSTPTWAGFCALINEARQKASLAPLGLLNPSLYPLIGTNNFRDITSGNNGSYNAGVGYDLVTGIGTPDVANLFQTLTPPPAPTLTSFAPASGLVGDKITITGSNFTLPGSSRSTVTGVTVNGAAATFHADSSTQITISAPLTSSGPIVIIGRSGSATSGSDFVIDPFTVTTTAAPGNGGSTSGGGGYLANESVSLLATPKAGYKFVHWRSSELVVSSSASYTFNATASASLIAEFVPVNESVYTITASHLNGYDSGGTVAGGGAFATHEMVTLEASPADNYTFVGWDDVSGRRLSNDATYRFNATKDLGVIAVFQEKSGLARVTIGSPVTADKGIFLTALPSVSLAGAATDPEGVAEIDWAINLGGGKIIRGKASGTANWTIDAVPFGSRYRGRVDAITISEVGLSGRVNATSVISVAQTDPRGTYSGILDGTDVAATSAGLAQATIAANDGFTAAIQWGGRRYPFHGQFDSHGQFTGSISRRGLSPLSVTVNLVDQDPYSLTGMVSDGVISANYQARRAFYSHLSRPCPFAGKYTALFQPNSSDTNAPTAPGVGVVSIDLSGNIHCIGSLADGTAWSQGVAISSEGIWPLYAALNRGGGYLSGAIQHQLPHTGDLSSFSGSVDWKAPVEARFALGIETRLSPSVQPYFPPRPMQPALKLGPRSAIVSGDQFASPLIKQIGFSTANRIQIADPAGDGLALTVNPANGSITGTVMEGGKRAVIQAVVSQRDDTASGCLLGVGTGEFTLGASTTGLPGPNLLTNGDFSAGATGFTSDYALIESGTSYSPGSYGVRSLSTNFNASYAQFGDHTNPGAGLMLLADGSTSSLHVWSESVIVTPNTGYYFSYWAASSDAINPPNLQVSINGMGLPHALAGSPGEWQQVQVPWFSGHATTALLQISDTNSDYEMAGDDFALDDLSFGTP